MIVKTSLGEVHFVGSLEREGPVIVAINGAFGGRDDFRSLDAYFPHPVLTSQLPGYQCPSLTETSVAAYCRAYDEALASLQRPVVVYGASLGGVVALGLRAPNVRHVVAGDPPL